MALGAAALVIATCGESRSHQHVRRFIVPVTRALERDLEAPREIEPVFAPGFGTLRVYLDAGHGAKDNAGNTSSFCVEEQEFTRFLALEVADYLEATGHFRVALSRIATENVAYADRLADARRFKADVFVSLHSDVRGNGVGWSPRPGQSCLKNVDLPGFAVLYADDGPKPLVERRLELARDVSARMAEAGFLRYTGEYVGLYENDTEDRAVFVDRHEESKRIFVLRRPPMPSIIVETHHALDPREAALWEEDDTRRAFSASLARALADFATGKLSESR